MAGSEAATCPTGEALASGAAFTPELLASVPAVTWRRAPGVGEGIVPHTAKGTFAGFLTMPFPACPWKYE